MSARGKLSDKLAELELAYAEALESQTLLEERVDAVCASGTPEQYNAALRSLAFTREVLDNAKRLLEQYRSGNLN